MKSYRIAIVLVMLLTIPLFAQSINITGKVIDQDSLPVSGATVKLSKANIQAISNDSGVFLLKNDITKGQTISQQSVHIEPVLRNGTLTFSVDREGEVIRVEIFNALGKRIVQLVDNKTTVGVYTANPFCNSSRILGSGLMILRLNIGNRHYTFRQLSLNQFQRSYSHTGSASQVFLKKTTANAVIDTMQISKTGFLDMTLNISDYNSVLQPVILFSHPAFPNTKNIGNDQFILKPYDSTLASTITVTVTAFKDSIIKAYSGDSLLALPVKLTPSTPITDSLGIAVLLPIDLSKISKPSNLNVFLTVQIDSVSFPVHGYLFNDTLFVKLPFIDSNMVIFPAYHNGLVTVTSDDSAFGSGLQKRLLTNPYTAWPAKKFWCSYNEKDALLVNAVRAAKGLNRDPTADEIQMFLISFIMLNAKTAGDSLRNNYQLNAPECQVIEYPPQSRRVSDNSPVGTYSKGPWYTVYVGNYPGIESHTAPELLGLQYGILHFGIFIDYNQLAMPFNGYFSIFDVLCHEMTHAIINGYDIDFNFLPWCIMAKGIQEGIATVMGHTIATGAVRTRNNEVYLLNFNLLDISTDYQNDDFFAYIGKCQNSMKYVSNVLSGLKYQYQIPDGRIAYCKGLDLALSHCGMGSLSNWYSAFIRNRAYEHNAASILRTGDPTTPDTINPAFATIAATISTSPKSISRTTPIPSFSSCAVAVDLSDPSIPASSYRITASASISLDDQNLLVIMYPEDTKGKMMSGAKPLTGSTFVLNTRNTKYATILLINNSFQDANNVQIAIKEIPPLVDFSATPTSGTAPLQVQFRDTVNQDSGSVVSWQWDFGDNASSTDSNPSHTYNDTGRYSVRLIATNSGDADTILKQQYITVTQQCKPQIYFSATPTSGIAPLQVQFTETDNFNNNLPTSWLWDFGDHTSDATKNPVHTFLTNGGFRISLSATNNNIKYTAFGGIFVYGVSSTTGVPARLYLSASSSEFPADGLSTTTGQAYILDANGNLITNGSNIVSFTLTGPGMIIGQNPTTFMAGLATILVKSSSTPGIIILTAVSPALTPSTVTFTTLGCQ